MNNIKQRLAKANGMNSMLCFRAKDRIDQLEKELQETRYALLSIIDPDRLYPDDEKIYNLQYKLWEAENSKSKSDGMTRSIQRKRP